jgi:hypothetical protein
MHFVVITGLQVIQARFLLSDFTLAGIPYAGMLYK